MDSRNKTFLVLFYVLLNSGGIVLAQNSPIDFETGGYGATWTVFENGGNPSLGIVTNPNTGGMNSSATVAKFTALQAGQPWSTSPSTTLWADRLAVGKLQGILLSNGTLPTMQVSQ